MKLRSQILLFFITFSITNVLAQCPSVGISGTHVSCYGGANGSVTTTVSGSPGPYSYTWNNGANTPSITGLVAGIYHVNVTDLTTGCTVFNLFTVNEPEQLTSSLTQQNVKCYSQSTGSIDLTPTGGTSPYSYSWSNGATSQDLSGLAAGSYSVTITDFKGCSTTNNTTITQTASALNSNITGQNIKCASGHDGSVNLTAFGGAPPYSYNWNSGTFLSEDLSGLTSGTYNVVITDQLGCTASNGIFLSEPSPVTSTITGSDVSCYGGNNGIVDVTPSGGTQPYSYSWTSSSFTLGNSQDLMSVPADSYTVTITDANSCTANKSFTVNEPSQLSSVITGTNVTCNGYSDGTINFVVNGGSAPYSYSWANSGGALPSTTQNLTNLPAESYMVTVTDFHNCTLTNSITISQPLLPLVTNIVGANVKCYGDNSGTADLTINGGTEPYSITWSTGINTEDQIGLFAGNYFVTVVDTNGCISNSNVIITQPSFPITASAASTPVTCFGFSDGAINYSISGGTPPYSYSWINSHYALSVVSQDITNFPVETYVITITDSNNCQLVDTSSITGPTQIQTQLVSNDINCFGDASGSVDLTVSGGIPPYNISWNNGSVTEDLNNLTAGNYVVIITDSNSCTHTDSIMITQPPSGLSSSWFVKNTSCYGKSDGYIFYNVQGGVQPYNYSWSNGDTVNNIFSLIAGTYIQTLTDANGCLLTDTIRVDQPQQIIISATTVPVLCFGQSNGSIDITITGGTLPFTYQWMDSSFVLSAISQDLVNFPANTYFLTVTDSAGCSADITVPITQPSALDVTATATNITCAGGSDGSIDIDVTGGAPSYSYSWSNGPSSEDISNLTAGSYSVNVTDANNCSLQKTYTIFEPPPIEISYLVQEVSCIDQHDGVISVTASGGTGTFDYSWSNGSTINPAINLSGGTYTITVMDFAKCTKDTSITMTVNPQECIAVPTAFTPNGDGKNDTWQILNIELYPHCNMQVFNQWGNLLFSSEGYSERWDGKYHGNKLPSETFYYILNLGNGAEPKTGSVTLVY